jgi:septum formation protein
MEAERETKAERETRAERGTGSLLQRRSRACVQRSSDRRGARARCKPAGSAREPAAVNPAHLLLCSASPRRRELLAALGLSFETLAPHIDESRHPGEPLEGLAERLARDKAKAGLSLLRARAPGGEQLLAAIALAADTVVTLDGEELGKPRDRAHARELLSRLSGRTHQVTTGVCVLSAGPRGPLGDTLRSCSVRTQVRFRALTPAQLSWLADTGDGDDKAGGYGVQGLAGAFIDRLEGSFTNVVGLPLAETLQLLAEAGLLLPWQAATGGLP